MSFRPVLALTLAACGGSAPAPVDADLGPDPFGRIARYPLDDDPADGVSAAVGLPGRCTRCPALVAGHAGGAYEFSGAAEVVLAPVPPALAAATAFSAAVWVRPAVAVFPEDVCVIGQAISASNDLNAWQLCVKPNLAVFACMSPAASCSTPGGSLQVGVWQQVALTFDGTTARVYVGATEVASNPRTLLSGGELVLGGDVDYGAPVALFIGALDDARVWNVALSASDVAAELAR